MIYVKDLQKLDVFKNIKLVSGKSGLTRRVAWPNIVQTDCIRDWLVGGDVIIVTGIGMRCDTELLNHLIQQAFDGDAACIIVLKNESYFKNIEPSTIEFSDKQGFPVFFAPWDTKLSILIKEISVQFLNDLHSEQMINDFLADLLLDTINVKSPENHEKMEQYGLTGAKRVISVQLEFNKNGPASQNVYYANAADQHMLLELIYSFRLHFSSLRFIQKNNKLIFLIDGSYTREQLLKKCKNILEQSKVTLDGTKIKIGIGRMMPRPEYYHKSFKEAEIALKLNCANPIRFIEDIGILQIIVEDDHMEFATEYANEVLKPLIRYDAQRGQDLVHTLSVLCDYDMNITQSAKQLFIHKNTMLKRVERIEEVLGVSLKDVEIKNSMYTCFKILKLFS